MMAPLLYSETPSLRSYILMYMQLSAKGMHRNYYVT